MVGRQAVIFSAMKISLQAIVQLASYPGSSPAEKRGDSLEELITCPFDVLCVVLCVVLIIKLLPTHSVPCVNKSVVGVLDPWMSLRLQMSTGRLFHCYVTSW